VHGAVEDAVQPQEPRALVELVLDLGALGDLDDGAEATLALLVVRIRRVDLGIDVVLGVHAASVPSG